MGKSDVGTACLQELGTVEHPELAKYVPFAVDAVESLLEGHSMSDQALAANLLDSILRLEFSDTDRRSITSQRDRLDTASRSAAKLPLHRPFMSVVSRVVRCLDRSVRWW